MKIQNVLLICCLTALFLSCEDDKNGNGDDHQPGVRLAFSVVDSSLDNLYDTLNPVYDLDSLYIIKKGSQDSIFAQDFIANFPDSLVYTNNMILYYTILSTGRPDFIFEDTDNYGPGLQDYYVYYNNTSLPDTLTVDHTRTVVSQERCLTDGNYVVELNGKALSCCHPCLPDRTDILRNLLIYK